MPRNEAADRYSPEMAPAFAAGPTVREATRKSDVLRANHTPSAPMAADSSATRHMPTSAAIAAPLIGEPTGARARGHSSATTLVPDRRLRKRHRDDLPARARSCQLRSV